MSVLNTAYQTLTLTGVNLNAIKEPIVTAFNGGQLSAVDEDFPLLTIVSNRGLLADIPAFNHPIELTIAGKMYIAMDCRYFVRQVQGETVIKHPSDYQLALLRAGLNVVWVQEDPKMFLGSLGVTMACYADWFTSTLTSRLTPQEYVSAKILAAYYYYSQFHNEEKMTSSSYVHVVGLISRQTRFPASQVQEVTGELPLIDSLETFCTVLKEQTQSTRLKDLNAGLMVTMLLNGWFGINSKEIVAAAVEHVPTWIALVGMALASRLHNKTKISVSVNRVVRKTDAGMVLRNLTGMANFDEANRLTLSQH